MTINRTLADLPTSTTYDVNGKEIILDADADTSITADTDDTIDIKIAGADDFQFTANTMSVLSGSTLNIDSGATIANSGTATGFGLTGVTTGSGNVTITSGNLIVASGNGIDFSATTDGTTMSSELFDDYEEGIYEATIVCRTSGSYGVNADYNTLSYTKIGRLVTVFGYLAVNSESSPVGQLKISLPFTVATLDEYQESYYSKSIVFVDHTDSDTDADTVGWVTGGQTTLNLYQVTHGSGAVTYHDHGDCDGNFAISINLSYLA